MLLLCRLFDENEERSFIAVFWQGGRQFLYVDLVNEQEFHACSDRCVGAYVGPAALEEHSLVVLCKLRICCSHGVEQGHEDAFGDDSLRHTRRPGGKPQDSLQKLQGPGLCEDVAVQGEDGLHKGREGCKRQRKGDKILRVNGVAPRGEQAYNLKYKISSNTAGGNAAGPQIYQLLLFLYHGQGQLLDPKGNAAGGPRRGNLQHGEAHGTQHEDGLVGDFSVQLVGTECGYRDAGEKVRADDKKGQTLEHDDSNQCHEGTHEVAACGRREKVLNLQHESSEQPEEKLKEFFEARHGYHLWQCNLQGEGQAHELHLEFWGQVQAKSHAHHRLPDNDEVEEETTKVQE
mmetsp:Transcript_225/g.529  ORF Transcript_225/g.529 Transcript_225/m.529 type:complete len:346 (+) Transcript_225:2323-3360(+)